MDFQQSIAQCEKSWDIDTCIQHALTATNEKLETPIIPSEAQMIELRIYVQILFGQTNIDPISETQSSNAHFFRENKLNNIGHNILTLLVLPHHGSSGNISRKMLELFLPDLLVISAGNGVLHGHPETETIKAYKRAKGKGLLSNVLLNSMKYESDLPSCITYSDKIEAKQIGHLVPFSEDLPLLSTNIHGTISFDIDGVYSDFSNVIEYQNTPGAIELLSINFRKRVDDTLLILELNKQKGAVLKKDDYYFYKLIYKDKNYYYNAL